MPGLTVTSSVVGDANDADIPDNLDRFNIGSSREQTTQASALLANLKLHKRVI